MIRPGTIKRAIAKTSQIPLRGVHKGADLSPFGCANGSGKKGESGEPQLVVSEKVGEDNRASDSSACRDILSVKSDKKQQWLRETERKGSC